jgi:hypothetical protein
MPSRIESLLVLLMCTALAAQAYPEYQQELPNIPTVNGTIWPGVGHFAREGGGRRNPFGQVRSLQWLLACAFRHNIAHQTLSLDA